MSDIILQKEVYETVCIKKHDGTVLSKFSFNPSDANIVERYELFVKGLEELSGKIISYEKMSEGKFNQEKAYEVFKDITNDIYHRVNTLLNEDVSDSIFSVMGPLSPLPSGDYYFMFIVDQIGIKVQKATGHRMKRIEMKIKKHTKKYHG